MCGDKLVTDAYWWKANIEQLGSWEREREREREGGGQKQRERGERDRDRQRQREKWGKAIGSLLMYSIMIIMSILSASSPNELKAP